MSGAACLRAVYVDLESIGDGAAVVFRSVVEESNFPVRERREEHVALNV